MNDELDIEKTHFTESVLTKGTVKWKTVPTGNFIALESCHGPSIKLRRT